MKKSRIRILTPVPEKRRRAIELYQDGRFKPRMVVSGGAYCRKNNFIPQD